MRRSLTIAAALALLISTAGAALAVSNDGSYEQGTDEEKNPWCMDEHSAIAPDPEGEGNPLFRIPLQVTFDGETVVRVCAGEHWDGQDPNGPRSDPDVDADEDEGTAYVNPLGDCSGWDSSENPDGCPGGTDRPEGPQEGELVHVRVTADADDGTGGEAVGVTVAHNLEIWGAGRWAGGAHADNGDREGYVAIMLEDNSDAIFADMLGDPLGHGDGNYLTIPFDPFLGGEAREGDCTQHDYTSDNRKCRRDNNAWTVEFGYNWLPLGTSADVETGPVPLP